MGKQGRCAVLTYAARCVTCCISKGIILVCISHLAASVKAAAPDAAICRMVLWCTALTVPDLRYLKYTALSQLYCIMMYLLCYVLEFVCLPWSEVCSARVTSLLLLLLLLCYDVLTMLCVVVCYTVLYLDIWYHDVM